MYDFCKFDQFEINLYLITMRIAEKIDCLFKLELIMLYIISFRFESF